MNPKSQIASVDQSNTNNNYLDTASIQQISEQFASEELDIRELKLKQDLLQTQIEKLKLIKKFRNKNLSSLSNKNYLPMLIAQALPTLYLSAYISLSHTQHPLSHSLLHSPLSLYLSIAHTHTRTHIFLKDSGKISSQLSKILKAAVQHENLCNGG